MKEELSLPINGKCKIAIIGLGYVGLPLAIQFSRNKKCLITGKKLERKVIGYDISEKRINGLRNAHDYTNQFSKNDLKDLKNIVFTTEEDLLKNADVFIITVPTPIDEFNIPDLKALKEASILVGKALTKKINKFKPIVIYESTVFPGATEDICIPLLSKFSNLILNEDYFCGYSPERINPGDKKHTLNNIVKITSGSNKESSEWIDILYGSIINAGTFRVQSIKIAETAKIIENTQRDINIALMNELSIICNLLKIDTLDVIHAASTKWNFLPFKPGLVGGHCIGVDPYYLAQKAQELGYNPEIILSGRRINDSMGPFIADEVIKALITSGKPVKNSKVLVLGITFKENCPDIRNTGVIGVIHRLNDFGLNITVYDPWANPDEVNNEYGIKIINKPSKFKFDAIILAVAHNEFKELDIESLKKDKSSVVYDVKGFLENYTHKL